MIHHADHGCQDTSLAFGRRLTEAGLIGSMGTVGDALDNAVAESFFATLEASCWTVIPGRHAPGCARRCSTSSRSSTTVNAATRPSTITAPYLRAAARISSPRRIATVSTKAVTGFTRQLAASVRVADPDRQAPMTDLFGGGPVYGGTCPALIFRDYIAAVLANHRVLDLPRSPGTIPSSGSAPAARALAATGPAGWRHRRHRRQ